MGNEGNQARNFLCALRARFKSEWGLDRNQFLGCVLNSSVRLEIGSGRSGNGLRCLEPGQKLRIFNSDHFTFLKNVNPTSGSRVSIKSHKKTPHEGGKPM